MTRILACALLVSCASPAPVPVPLDVADDTPPAVDATDAVSADASPPCTPHPGECWLWVRGGPWGDEHLGVCCDAACTCDLAVWREHDPHLTMAGALREGGIPGDLEVQDPDGTPVVVYTCDPACNCTWTPPAVVLDY